MGTPAVMEIFSVRLCVLLKMLSIMTSKHVTSQANTTGSSGSTEFWHPVSAKQEWAVHSALLFLTMKWRLKRLQSLVYSGQWLGDIILSITHMIFCRATASGVCRGWLAILYLSTAQSLLWRRWLQELTPDACLDTTSQYVETTFPSWPKVGKTPEDWRQLRERWHRVWETTQEGTHFNRETSLPDPNWSIQCARRPHASFRSVLLTWFLETKLSMGTVRCSSPFAAVRGCVNVSYCKASEWFRDTPW